MDAAKARELLVELRTLLVGHGERNWLRGVEAALGEIDSGAGVEGARSIWQGMNGGAGSFSDLYLDSPEPAVRREANERLGRIAGALWRELDLG